LLVLVTGLLGAAADNENRTTRDASVPIILSEQESHPAPHVVELGFVGSTPLPPVVVSHTTILNDLADSHFSATTHTSYSAPPIKIDSYDSISAPDIKSNSYSAPAPKSYSSEPHHDNPVYSPKKILEPTKAKCRIEEVKVTAEICTPTVSKDCKTMRLKTKNLKNKRECLKIIKTVCTEREEEEDNEVCYFEYNTEQESTDASTVEVEYQIRCESTSQEYCPPKQGYGQGYGHATCKHQNTKVCYNEPSLEQVKQSVTVEYPVANEVCVNNQVTIPRVECEEVETETCIDLPYTQEETVELEKCGAELDKPKCKETILTLPTQICEEILEYEAPAPAYHSPAPAYNAPASSYSAPAPSYNAPVQSYAPSYSAPSYSG